MKHPALTRMMGVFLAVVSLITMIAGGLGFGRSVRDHQEQVRQEELLQKRIDNATALIEQLALLQSEYEDASALFPDRDSTHRKESSDYRMKLGTYTATRAGLVLGREQLDEAAAALKQGIRMYYIGLEAFEKGEAAFQPIYSLYQTVRSSMDQGLGIYQNAQSRMSGDEDAVLQPEDVLALIELEHQTNAQMEELLIDMRDDMPSDQREAEKYLRQAANEYNKVAPELAGFNISQLAYQATSDLYGQAQSAMDEGLASGASQEEAKAAADQICQDNFGMSFDEVGQWLDENPPSDTGEAPELSPEMLDLALQSLPNDKELVNTALGMLSDSDQALSGKEAAFRADPHSMSAAELLLAAAGEGLEAAQRMMGLVEPGILQAKAAIDQGRVAMNDALVAIGRGQRSIAEGYAQLDETAADLDSQLEEMKEEKLALEKKKLSLDELEAVIDNYDSLEEHFRSARALLMSYDGIYDPVKNQDADLIESAKAELLRQQQEHEKEYTMRRIICLLMLPGGAFGILTALGCFEKPRIKKLWLPLLAAILFTGAGELLSIQLGRGLWYSAIFVVVFGVLTFPLTIGNRKEEQI